VQRSSKPDVRDASVPSPHLILGALVLVPIAALTLQGASSAETVTPVFAEDGMAIRGTDPVAY
jgi:hypothetical protein